jgi:polyisoprenoid-binding protein YceI
MKAVHLRALGLALALSIPAAAASATCPAGLPPGVGCGVPEAAKAPAGAYALDVGHTAVIARVSHIGYSMSVFRFDQVAATLTWNPASPAGSSLSVTVQTASISTPVKGFAAELIGAPYLNAAAFPTATFVSTAFHQTDATHGTVDGQFTLKGKTKPVTFKVTLLGAGPGFGKPRIGIEAIGWINPQDFGMSPMFIDPIELVIDAEFVKTP